MKVKYFVNKSSINLRRAVEKWSIELEHKQTSQQTLHHLIKLPANCDQAKKITWALLQLPLQRKGRRLQT